MQNHDKEQEEQIKKKYWELINPEYAYNGFQQQVINEIQAPRLTPDEAINKLRIQFNKTENEIKILLNLKL